MSDMFPLLPAEEKLLECLSSSKLCDFDVKKDDIKNRKIRSEFIVEMIRGNNSKIPATGICIFGAYIVGNINISEETIPYPLHLQNCEIIGDFNLSGSSIKRLILKGTSVFKLNLNEVHSQGNIILSYNFRTLYPVMIMGAKIDGQLGCSGGSFQGYPVAISLESTVVSRSFFWRFIKNLWGHVDFTNASVGTLCDDSDSWPKHGQLSLSGFTYKNLESNTTTSYFDRIDWLMRQSKPHLNQDFRPQPFEHLSKVLKETGRENEAVKITVKKIHLQNRANFLRRDPELVELKNRIKLTQNIFSKLSLYNKIESIESNKYRNLECSVYPAIIYVLQGIYWLLAGYGYYPLRCMYWGIIFVFAGSLYFDSLYNDGVLIYNGLDLAEGIEAKFPFQFHSWVYALDLFVPIVDLNHSKYFSLRPENSMNSNIIVFVSWSFVLFGWILSAIFAASVAGLVRR